MANEISIGALHVSSTSFVVQDNHVSAFAKGQRILCIAGSSVIEVSVVSAEYDAGRLLTTVVVEDGVIPVSLVQVQLGLTYADPDNQSGNIGKHRHTAPWDGGEIPFTDVSQAEVDNLRTIDIPAEINEFMILRVSDPYTDGYELVEVQSVAEQTEIEHDTGVIRFGTAQDIGSVSSPTFAGVTLTGLTGLLEAKGATAVGVVAASGALQVLRRNAAGTAYEFVNLSVGDLHDALFASIATGDIIYRNGAGKWANLAKGEIGQTLGVKTDGTVGYDSHPFIAQLTAAYETNLAEFDVVYMDTLDEGKCGLAQANGTYDEIDAMGIVVEPDGIDNDETGSVLLRGFVTNPAWSWSVGAKLYLSDTPGLVSETPGSTEVFVGRAVAADTIFFDPAN
jgi:hypothetical protein